MYRVNSPIHSFSLNRFRVHSSIHLFALSTQLYISFTFSVRVFRSFRRGFVVLIVDDVSNIFLCSISLDNEYQTKLTVWCLVSSAVEVWIKISMDNEYKTINLQRTLRSESISEM